MTHVREELTFYTIKFAHFFYGFLRNGVSFRVINSYRNLIRENLEDCSRFLRECVYFSRLEVNGTNDLAADFQRESEFGLCIWQKRIGIVDGTVSCIINNNRLTSTRASTNN